MAGIYQHIAGGVTAPLGFRSSAVACGIKKPGAPKLDLAVIATDLPSVTTGVFTTNRIKAAPVRVCQNHLRSNDIRAVIANSGNANCCTGAQGICDAKAMCATTAEGLGIRDRQVLVASTGIIGKPMPMDRILPRIPEVIGSLSEKGGPAFAEAIMTSDTRPKCDAIEVKVGTKIIRIGAAAKGAGMICPHMATMLCFITTDARIGKAELDRAMREAVDLSFNRISVDGDMSTNDSVIVMANGAAGGNRLKNGSRAAREFREALAWLMLRMAKLIVRDGERVTKYVEVAVRGARTHEAAKKVARAVATSTLVKCAWNGSDPNWGRIIHAIGYSGVAIREETIDIYFDGLVAAKGGVAAETPLEELLKVAANPAFTVTIDLHQGDEEYRVYTSDLSPEYADFNREEYSALKNTAKK
ncbi:MAG: bifunctional glutamate N-acetyltransferase/amino-acid acetyltransferase ArgJ [Verrucomicrobiales bacterium]